VGALQVQVRSRAGGWVTFPPLTVDMPPASVANHHDGRREVIVFYCYGDHSIIEQSRAGVDVEVGALREVRSTDMIQLARLGPGESYEQAVRARPEPDAPSMLVRWSHLE